MRGLRFVFPLDLFDSDAGEQIGRTAGRGGQVEHEQDAESGIGVGVDGRLSGVRAEGRFAGVVQFSVAFHAEAFS